MTEKPVIVETETQSLILTELQGAHKRLAEQLRRIEREARESAGYANLDTTFLTGKTQALPGLVGAYEAYRTAAKWAGCNKDAIGAVCQLHWVIIEVQDEQPVSDTDFHGPWNKEEQRYEDGCKEDVRTHARYLS
jgi:hypothetical protein